MARRKKKRKSIPGFEARDRHGPLDGVDGAPQGRVVTHGAQVEDSEGNIGSPYRVRDVLDVLLANGKLTKTTRDAGRRFEEDFGFANLVGVHAVDWLREGGIAEAGSATERVIAARGRVMAAMDHLGGVKSPQAEVAWHVLGLGMTIKDYAEANQLVSGRSGNPQFVAGLVVGSCGSLVAHYRL